MSFDRWGGSWGNSWGPQAVSPDSPADEDVARFFGEPRKAVPVIGFLNVAEQPDTLIALLMMRQAGFDFVAMDNDFLLLAGA